ncbi:MAG: hypothetical protein ACHQ0J_11995 [Candidatus Dormibacterales bacterium]
MPARKSPPGQSAVTALVARLNDMVAGLVRENRRLRQQILKLSQRGKASPKRAVGPRARSTPRRVKRAPAAKAKKKTARPAAPKKGLRTAARRKPRAR